MKRVRVTTAIMAMAFISLTAMSCKDSKKEDSDDAMDTEMNHDGMNHDDNMDGDNMGTSNDRMDSNTQSSDAKQIVADYMTVKDALVADSQEAAANAGKKLESTFEGFNMDSYTAEQQKELKDIIDDAKEHAEHIGKSELDHQREHFDVLSKDVIDMVAITGPGEKLYQYFCPMYNDKKGARWLSENKEVKNPYFGSKMVKCGELEKEIE